MMQQSPKTRLEAEFPVKGSELLPPDSSKYELEVRNAILLLWVFDWQYEYATSEYSNENEEQV